MNKHNREQANKSTFVTIKKSQLTNSYIALQSMNYDTYLLYLLFTETLTLPSSIHASLSIHQFEKNAGISFCKNSSLRCLATSKLLLHKNNGYIELHAIYDLKNTDELCLPKSPVFVMTAKNFMNFMTKKAQIYKQQPEQFFIVLDAQGHAHLTEDLQTLTKKSFLAHLQTKFVNLFTRSIQ